MPPGGLPRNSFVRLTDRSDMTSAVHCGYKATNQTKLRSAWLYYSMPTVLKLAIPQVCNLRICKMQVLFAPLVQEKGFVFCPFNMEANKTLSRIMRKPTFCKCENKDADQLLGHREADQRLCFRYIDSTIPLLSKSEISSL